MTTGCSVRSGSSSDHVGCVFRVRRPRDRRISQTLLSRRSIDRRVSSLSIEPSTIRRLRTMIRVGLAALLLSIPALSQGIRPKDSMDRLPTVHAPTVDQSTSTPGCFGSLLMRPNLHTAGRPLTCPTHGSSFHPEKTGYTEYSAGALNGHLGDNRYGRSQPALGDPFAMRRLNRRWATPGPLSD